jgi:hypothetical protein
MAKTAKKETPAEPNIYFSPGKKGFYNDQVHTKKQIPSDAIAITKEHYDSLLVEQSKGKEIGVDELNRPVASVPVLSQADKTQALKVFRREKEYAGFKHKGALFPSDEKTEMRLSTGAVAAAADPEYKIENWTVDGGKTSKTLDAETINELLKKMATHHAACFAAEVQVSSMLAGLESRDDISDAFEKAYSKLI